jgi:hypothetical protein
MKIEEEEVNNQSNIEKKIILRRGRLTAQHFPAYLKCVVHVEKKRLAQIVVSTTLAKLIPSIL